MVESKREVADVVSEEVRFFIGSVGTDVSRFAHSVRAHRGIENSPHWSLDIAFREYESRLRDPNARENFASRGCLTVVRSKGHGSNRALSRTASSPA